MIDARMVQACDRRPDRAPRALADRTGRSSVLNGRASGDALHDEIAAIRSIRAAR